MPGQRRGGYDKGGAVAAADFALSAGFGSTASVAVAAGSTDLQGSITITSAGTGQGANPTCTLTFKSSYANTAPIVLATRAGTGDQLTVPILARVSGNTVILTFVGTPVAAETYTVQYAIFD